MTNFSCLIQEIPLRKNDLKNSGSAKFSLVTYNATLLSYFGFLCLGKGFIGFKNFMCENTGKIFERAKVFMILERPSEEANCNMISEIR